jgi:hypothetical protein
MVTMSAYVSEVGWYPPGVLPEVGKRYEWQNFFGNTFVATLDSFEFGDLGDGDGNGLILDFTDHEGFKTNLPIRFRDALED